MQQNMAKLPASAFLKPKTKSMDNSVITAFSLVQIHEENSKCYVLFCLKHWRCFFSENEISLQYHYFLW